MFKFRLQKLLFHRGQTEQAAKAKYLERKSACVATEQEIVVIQEKRTELGHFSPTTVANRMELGALFSKFEDDERLARAALAVQLDETAAAETNWIHAKRELQIVEKLREKDFAEWTLEEDRKAQNALDEWSVLRRGSKTCTIS